MHRLHRTTYAAAAACVLLGLVAASAGAAPGPSLTRLNSYGAAPIPSFGMTRTADGTLHLIYQTTPAGGGSSSGLTTRTISASGVVGPEQPALTGWGPGRPGMAALPDGTLVAAFGAISPLPNQVSSFWSITSSDGGATWSAPADATSGTNEALIYSSDITVQASGSTPVVTAAMAGGIVAQQGLGPGSPTTVVTDSTDDFAGIVNTAVDAATQEVVASWSSNAGSGGEFIRGVAPTLGSLVKLPGQRRNGVVVAGRDTGPGVYAAYTPDDRHVSLYRYGGGSVPVGSSPTVTPQDLAVATGPQGRIWVMWGDEAGNPGLVVTRSNKAVTKFEPLQQISMHALQLQRIGGEGRLGPLDLLVDYRPSINGPIQNPGLFHARVLPVLSATAAAKAVKNKKTHKVTGYKVTVHVTDAGDAVAGATANVSGKKAKTAGNGTVQLTLPASAGKSGKLTVAAPGYQTLTKKIKL